MIVLNTTARMKTRVLVVLLIQSLVTSTIAKEGIKLPNVLLLFVDDMGYGDLHVQGNESVYSPNIDKLAETGVRFTQWISASSICTPSRGALMTGRLPVRLGLASNNFYQRVLSPVSPGGLPFHELTIAEALKDRGYSTYMVGKWHLGIGNGGAYLPPNHGFDEYYGVGVTNVQSCMPGKHIFKQSSVAEWLLHTTGHIWAAVLGGALTLYIMGFIGPTTLVFSLLLVIGIFFAILYFANNYTLLTPNGCILYRNYEIIQQPFKLYNMTQRNTQNALDFISSAYSLGKPWFLYMSYLKVHTALFANRDFHGATSTFYGDNIAELDWSVGTLLNHLERLGIKDDTMIWFSSDNGPYLERGIEGGGAGQINGIPLRGGKGQTWEGGIRVPGIVNYPRLFPKGKVIHQAVNTMDIFPTTIAVVDKIQASKNSKLVKREPYEDLDGKNITPLIMGETNISPHENMFHYCGETLQAVRHGSRYKLFFYTPKWEQGSNSCPSQSVCGCSPSDSEKHDLPLLFDLLEDPGESHPLTPDNFPEYEAIRSSILKAVAEHEASFITGNPKPINQCEAFWDLRLMPCCDPPSCKCDKDETVFEPRK